MDKYQEEKQIINNMSIPKSKSQLDLEAMQKQYSHYEKMKAEGLFATINPKSPITKNKSNKEYKNYELKQYSYPNIKYINPPFANVNVPVDASGNLIGGVEIDVIDNKSAINIDRQTLLG